MAGSLCCGRFLRYISTIIFLNKIDLLAEKITNGKTLDMLIDGMDPQHPYYDMVKGFYDFHKPKGKSTSAKLCVFLARNFRLYPECGAVIQVVKHRQTGKILEISYTTFRQPLTF